MNNNELIQENFNESVEVNNPYIPGLNSLESDEIAKHSGSYSVPTLNDFDESTSLSNDRSLIEIENQITDGNTISSNNYDFLTGTTGSSPLLNVGKDFEHNPDLSTVDINLNRLDTSTSALRFPDSLGERFDRSSNTILITPQPTDLTQSSNADANDSDAVVSSPISERDSSFDGENSGQVTIEALEKNTEIPSNYDIETIDSNLKSDVGTDEEVYQNKQKQYDRIDDDGHHKEHEKEHEKDGEGREIEIDSLKKAIAFFKKNDIFNLPKKISEVEIEVETGKKGLNKLLKISQFKDILAKAGLPTGAKELKKLLKGDNEREIEKKIKLPNGSTISVEFEVGEGKIGFSLEVERGDEGSGSGKGGTKGLRNIAKNVLSSLIDFGTKNLAGIILKNQIGLKVSFEDIKELVSGEESVGEFLGELGKKGVRKLAEYPLQQLKNAFEINPQQVLASIGTLGLDSNLINTFTNYLGDKIGFNKFIQTQDGQQILSALSEEKGQQLIASVLGGFEFNPIGDISLLGTVVWEKIQNAIDIAKNAGQNVTEAIQNTINRALNPDQAISFYYDSAAVVNILILDARDGEIYGKNVFSGEQLDVFQEFAKAWNNLHKMAFKFYGNLKNNQFQKDISTQEFKDWQNAIQLVREKSKNLASATGKDSGLIIGLLKELKSSHSLSTTMEWKDLFQIYYGLAREVKETFLPMSPEEHKAYLERLSFVVNFIPVLGQAKGVADLLFQRDIITQEKFGLVDNILGILGSAADVFEFATDAGKILAVKKGGSGFEIVTGGSDYIRNLTLKATGGDPNNLVTLEITKDGNQVGKITVNKNDVDVDKVKSKIVQQDLEVRVDSGSGGGPGDPPDKPPTGGGGSFDDLPDDIKKAINNKNFTDDIKQQYARILTGEKKDIAEKLIRTQIDNFDPLVDVQKFENVVNALNSIDDVARIQRVFDNNYLQSLSKKTKKRYNQFLERIQQGIDSFPPIPDYIGRLTISKRLAILDEIKDIRTTLFNKVQLLQIESNRLLNLIALERRNISFGSYLIKLPNGRTIEGNYLALSGDKISYEGMRKSITDYIGKSVSYNTIDGPKTRQVVTEIPSDPNKQFFSPIIPKNLQSTPNPANDSERKVFEYILTNIQQDLKKQNININRLQDPQNPRLQPKYGNLNISGTITLYSEYTPCDSCADIITKQFQNYFGNNIKVEIKYGVDFKIVENK